MDINIILLLATVLTITHQEKDALCSSWHYNPSFEFNHYWATQDCPLVHELKNLKNIIPSSDTKCFCTTGNGRYYECPGINTNTNPDGYFNDFLFCWKNSIDIEDDSRYLLTIPSTCSTWKHLDCHGKILEEKLWPTPLLKYHPHLDEQLQDSRCNHNVRAIYRLINQEMGYCLSKKYEKKALCKNQKHLVQVFKKHKKGRR